MWRDRGRERERKRDRGRETLAITLIRPESIYNTHAMGLPAGPSSQIKSNQTWEAINTPLKRHTIHLRRRRGVGQRGRTVGTGEKGREGACQERREEESIG